MHGRRCEQCGGNLRPGLVCLHCVDQAKRGKNERIANLEQQLAVSEAACAQMRQALEIARDEYLPWYPHKHISVDGIRARSVEWQELDAALAPDAGASLLAELAALRAVAEAAQLFLQSQTLRLVHAVIEGKKDKEGTGAILKQQVHARHSLDIALATLAQAQQTHQDENLRASQVKDEVKGGEAPEGQQNG